jgi:HPt (histidine-containing phosphotransfer) domain-containing protein
MSVGGWNVREQKNLSELSSLGHYLKGSSAALGVSKVQASCEKIQHCGQPETQPSEKENGEALRKIELLLEQVKVEHAEAERWLKKWYDNIVEKVLES